MRDNIIFVKKSVKSCMYMWRTDSRRRLCAMAWCSEWRLLWEGFSNAATSCLKSFCSRREPAYGPHFGFRKPSASGLKKPLMNAVVLTEPRPPTLRPEQWCWGGFIVFLSFYSKGFSMDTRSSHQLLGLICYPLLKALSMLTS